MLPSLFYKLFYISIVPFSILSCYPSIPILPLSFLFLIFPLIPHKLLPKFLHKSPIHFHSRSVPLPRFYAPHLSLPQPFHAHFFSPFPFSWINLALSLPFMPVLLLNYNCPTLHISILFLAYPMLPNQF